MDVKLLKNNYDRIFYIIECDILLWGFNILTRTSILSFFFHFGFIFIYLTAILMSHILYSSHL